MTTKEQERKALEQIRSIIESLGEGSYIGAAFEGCLDIAEENIADDMACSMKQRWESAQADLAKSVEENRSLRKKIDEQEASICTLNCRLDEAGKTEAQLRTTLADTAEELYQTNVKCVGLQADLEAETAKVAALEQQIIMLKAKLYDYVVAQ